MTFKSSGTGMENSIPKIREREGNKKNHSQNSGTGVENPFPKLGNEKGIKKIHSQNSGTGIGGSHSRELPGTGMERKYAMTRNNIIINITS